MKKIPFIALIFMIAVSTVLIFLSSPQTIKSVEIKTDSNLWNEEITSYILSVVKPGSTLDDVKPLENNIESLPWVKDCKASFIRGKLKIDISSVKPKMAIFYNKYYYIIGENNCILKKQGNKPEKLQVFFYKGKEPFYYKSSHYYKVKDSILLEISIVQQRLSRENPINEKPEVILTDNGIKLIYMKNKVIVLIGNDGNSWKNFIKFFKMEKKPISDMYDFRFSGLLVLKGRNRHG